MTLDDLFTAALAGIFGFAALYLIAFAVLGGPDAWYWLAGRLFALVLR